jgi:hypothetical protein
MPYLEELLPEFRKGAKIRRKYWGDYDFVEISDFEKGLIFTNKELEASDWEFYQEPIDWNYIIENRCLCWFWDDDLNWAICGILGKIEKGAEYEFIMFDDAGNRSSYKNCRPVHRDEVNFYEDIEK